MRWFSRVLLATASLALAACAANPIRQAETLEQRAYAAYGTFVIMEESVVRLTAPGSALPRDVQLAMIGGVERAQPVVDTLNATLREYQTTRADFEAQRVNSTVFDTVVNSLGNWVVRAEGVVNDLKAAVRRGQ